jgi:YHS domain-containing protein
MLRLALVLILLLLIALAFWRVVDGVIDGLSGRQRSPGVGRGLPMVRDPVCGTFVLPDRAVTLAEGSERVFFCSTACRDEYRARPSTRSGSPRGTSSGGHVEGRTA